MKKVDLFDFSSGKSSGICGIHIDESGTKPLVHLFEISENQNNSAIMTDNIPQVCSRVAERKLGGIKLDDADWRITSSIHNTSVRFQSVSETVLKISFDNTIPAGSTSYLSANGYQEALNSSDGFEKSITGKHGFAQRGSSDVFLLQAPLHPDGYSALRSQPSNTVLLLDAKLLKKEWQSSSRIDMLRSYKDGNLNGGLGEETLHLLASTPETSSAYMPHTGVQESPELAKIAYRRRKFLRPLETGTGLQFINGRHRTANLIATGADAVPISFSGTAKELENLQDKAGYRRPPPIRHI